MTPAPPYAPPPTRCETLAAMMARCGGDWLSRSAVAACVYGLPANASTELREFWGQNRFRGPLEAGVARLPGGRFFGEGIVLAPDGRSVARDVSLEFGRGEDTHWLLGENKMKEPKIVPGTTVLVASTLGDGYCHWLLDELPRLLTLPGEFKKESVVAHASLECSRTAFGLLGWTGAVVEPARRGHWQCEQFIVPTFSGWTGQATKAQLNSISHFVERLPHDGAGKGERIYISRAAARRRRVSNEAEVAAALGERGFTTVRMEELTWAEQVAAFRRAKVIVAAHGAGLANLAFCAPGTRVVECFNRDYVNDCFWQIAAIRGLDYRAVIPDGPGPMACVRRSNRMDFTINVGQLLDALP